MEEQGKLQDRIDATNAWDVDSQLELALDALRKFRSATGGEIPLIGVGGISNANDAWERIRAGASLIQLYSAMVYEGPGIARRIADGLAQMLERDGYSSISEVVGSDG